MPLDPFNGPDMSQREHGGVQPEHIGIQPIAPARWKRLTDKQAICPRPDCQAQLCECAVLARGRMFRGGWGIMRWLGCPSCAYASPSMTMALPEKEARAIVNAHDKVSVGETIEKANDVATAISTLNRARQYIAANCFSAGMVAQIDDALAKLGAA